MNYLALKFYFKISSHRIIFIVSFYLFFIGRCVPINTFKLCFAWTLTSRENTSIVYLSQFDTWGREANQLPAGVGKQHSLNMAEPTEQNSRDTGLQGKHPTTTKSKEHWFHITWWVSCGAPSLCPPPTHTPPLRVLGLMDTPPFSFPSGGSETSPTLPLIVYSVIKIVLSGGRLNLMIVRAWNFVLWTS